MRISDWSSDVCSSDLAERRLEAGKAPAGGDGERRGTVRGEALVVRQGGGQHLRLHGEDNEGGLQVGGEPGGIGGVVDAAGARPPRGSGIGLDDAEERKRFG